MDVMMLSLADLSDQDLLARTMHLAADERQGTALLIAHLAEQGARRLYLAEGSSSLFTYCTQVLRLSEHAAYGRIEAARAARRFPLVLEMLAEGAVTLAAVGLLAPPSHGREPQGPAGPGPAQKQARGGGTDRGAGPAASRPSRGPPAARGGASPHLAAAPGRWPRRRAP